MTNEEIIKSALKFLVQKQTEQGSWGFSDDNDNEISWNEVIEWLEQEPITWIVGKDNCQVAVRNMPIDKMQKICAIIGEKEQQPCEDCISREYLLDRWFTVFNDDGVGLRVVLKKDIEDAPSVATQRNNASEIIRRIEQARDKDKNAGEYPYNRCIEIVREVMDGSMDEGYG